MQFGGESDLGVDDGIRGQVLDAFKATRCSDSAVCITATVCANGSRYRTSDPLCAAVLNQCASPSASAAGRPSYPILAAISSIVEGRKPPSRWSCSRALGAYRMESRVSGAAS